MPKFRPGIATLLLAILLIMAGPSLWRSWNHTEPGYCSFCHRPEHTESLVRAQPEGEPVREACCLSCVLSYQRQTGKAVRVLAVTEHDSGRLIDPAGAAFVVASDESPCQHDMVHLGDSKRFAEIRWDRCLPSILAFDSRDRAEAFQARHGGELHTLAELQEQQTQ